MKFEKPDGVIEIEMSSCGCCAPGQKHPGIHTRTVTFWARTGIPPIAPWSWENLGDLYAYKLALKYAEAVATAETFQNQMRGNDFLEILLRYDE